MIGRTIAHYRIVERIGEGGMGVVYRARDERLERDVAFKVLPAGLLADELARRRFRKEALALSQLNHPNVQTVHDFDRQDDVDFLVTEYVAGATVRERVEAGALSEKEVARLGTELADGLAAAHERGIVHRDLKPENLRMTADARLKILDFGLAQWSRPAVDATTTRGFADAHAGTPPYMAPEQLRGEPIDTRTDLFAAGCVLYELSTGRRAFPQTTVPQLTDAILHGSPVLPRALNAQLSPELERIILKCLERDPDERYQSAKELAVDLRRLLAARITSAMPLRPPKGRSPSSTVWASLLAVAALIAAAVLVAVWKSRSADDVAHAPIHSLAVLPLENLMGDPEQEYIVAAMHEALIAELGQISALRTIPRTSVERYRKTAKSVQEIARELNVDALVEGSMFRQRDSVRVQLQLVSAAPVERQIWAQGYEGDLQDVLALQKRVARAISDEIRVTVTPQEAARLATTRRVIPAAYDAWAKGWFQFTRLTGDSLQKCVEYAAAALAMDSTYAPAYALAASCYSTLANVGSVAPRDAFTRTDAAAHKALEIDEGLADAHFALAWKLAGYDRDWPGAEREYRRGLELNPSSAFGHGRFGWFLSWLGRSDEALSEVGQAQQLNPTGLYEMQALSAVLYAARRYDDAIVAARRATEVAPTYTFGFVRLGVALSDAQRYDEAIAALETAETVR